MRTVSETEESKSPQPYFQLGATGTSFRQAAGPASRGIAPPAAAGKLQALNERSRISRRSPSAVGGVPESQEILNDP